MLEAIRQIDTPPDQQETEYVQELRNKKLGLNDTVYVQIRRYTDAVKRAQPIPFAEVAGLGTLIGRRPDAEELFKSAGRILATDIYESMGATSRGVIHAVPGFVARPIALRELQAAATRILGGSLSRTGGSLTLRIPESVTVNGATESVGCLFYEHALRELLRLLVNGGTQVEHVQCTRSGGTACEWRADWRGGRQEES